MGFLAKDLALNGGVPVRVTPLPPARLGGALIGDRELASVTEVIERGRLFRFSPKTCGPGKVDELELALAGLLDRQYILCVSSGTAALTLSLSALGVGAGDIVVLPTFVWVGVANAVLSVGAVPIFVDVDRSLSLSPVGLEACGQASAVIVPHMAGEVADISAISELACRKGLKLIEDCAQGLGALLNGRAVGHLGQISAYSLQDNKIISTGDGGFLATDDCEIFESIVRFHDHGAYRLSGGTFARLSSDGFGNNYRMNEMTAAIGLAQLGRLDEIVNRLHEVKHRITSETENLTGLSLRSRIEGSNGNATSLTFMLDNESLARNFSVAMTAEGVPVHVVWDNPRHIYHHFINALSKRILRNASAAGLDIMDPYLSPLPNKYQASEDIFRRAVRIELSPIYDENDVTDIIVAIKKVGSIVHLIEDKIPTDLSKHTLQHAESTYVKRRNL